MAPKRCENGHYYDPAKHTSCPLCGVGNIDFGHTAPKRAAEVPPSAPPAEQKTTPLIREKEGIDPVVGWLVCVQGAARGRDFRVHSERNFIGRSPTMDICVPGDGTVSRENHAIISYNPKDRQFKLQPGGSRGLIYVNGTDVDSARVLASGDRIELGLTTLMFVPLCGPEFSWE